MNLPSSIPRVNAGYPRDQTHSSAAESLRRACERLEARPTESTIAAVTTAAVSFSIELRDHGLLPEQMLVALKAILCDTGLLELHHDTGDQVEMTPLYEQVITKCINAYFADPAL